MKRNLFLFQKEYISPKGEKSVPSMDVFASLTDRNWCFPLCSVWRNYPAQLHKPFGNKIPWYEKLPIHFFK